MDIRQFVDAYLGREESIPYEDTGPRAEQTLLHTGKDVQQARQLLSWNFWNSYLQTHSWNTTTRSLGIDPFLVEKMLVERPEIGRSDLVVLSPGFSKSPTVVHVKVADDDLEHGWAKWQQQLTDAQKRATSFLIPQMALESYHTKVFYIIYAEKPEMEDLADPRTAASTEFSLPASPQTVEALGSSTFLSTAGSLVKDKGSLTGVTCALHCLLKAQLKIGDQVAVGNAAAKITYTDPMTDSAFLAFSPLPLKKIIFNGIMSGKVPWPKQPASFAGITTPLGNTRVDATDPALPTVLPSNMLRVYTPRDAQPGDSGSALVTDDDYVGWFPVSAYAVIRVTRILLVDLG